MSLNLSSSMKSKQVEFEDWVDDLNKAAAKHLVKLGVEKDWKDVYRRMKNRRKKRERST
jgi:hypothetical protein